MSQYGHGGGYHGGGYGTPPMQPQGYMAPHRGGTVLALGILSLVICQLLGPIAWSMASKDLTAMDQGAMDPSGRSTTQAGKILGIVGTVLLLLGVTLAFLQLVLGIAILGGAAIGRP